ncbi:MAG: hypothetical protein QNI92_06665 [Desulfobacterales bacterium]|nr:hypothetical protein [Desulfobacterales bacterium]
MGLEPEALPRHVRVLARLKGATMAHKGVAGPLREGVKGRSPLQSAISRKPCQNYRTKPTQRERSDKNDGSSQHVNNHDVNFSNRAEAV